MFFFISSVVPWSAVPWSPRGGEYHKATNFHLQLQLLNASRPDFLIRIRVITLQVSKISMAHDIEKYFTQSRQDVPLV